MGCRKIGRERRLWELPQEDEAPRFPSLLQRLPFSSPWSPQEGGCLFSNFLCLCLRDVCVDVTCLGHQGGTVSYPSTLNVYCATIYHLNTNGPQRMRGPKIFYSARGSKNSYNPAFILEMKIVENTGDGVSVGEPAGLFSHMIILEREVCSF